LPNAIIANSMCSARTGRSCAIAASTLIRTWYGDSGTRINAETQRRRERLLLSLRLCVSALSLMMTELQPTPRSLGYRMPAEWEPHEATWLSWPHKEE